MKTFSLKSGDIKRDWVLIDASEAPLGRISTVVATHLIGKHRPNFTPHMDSGDFVVVINASAVTTTGNKEAQKRYYNHSGYPGSLKEVTLEKKIATDPESVITHAVKGMLPKNKLQSGRMARLKVFAGSEYPHEAQQPTKITVKAEETK